MYSSLFAHSDAAFVFSGDSLFGSPRSDCIESRICVTPYADDHCSCAKTKIKIIDIDASNYCEKRGMRIQERPLSGESEGQTLRMSRQMFPYWSTFGWKQLVSNFTTGATYG